MLVCDTGSIDGGLAALAAVETPRSLTEASARLAHGLPVTGGLYVVDPRTRAPDRELRVIAAGPRVPASGDRAALGDLLVLARSNHRLTVVDCGTLQRPAQRYVLSRA